MSERQEPQASVSHGQVAAPAPEPFALRAAEPGPGGSATGLDPAQGRRLNLRRDQLFRHTLLGADAVTFVLAFTALDLLSSRSLRLTWLSIVGLLGMLLVVKLVGLYDRDEALLHKTTLDEAPKLLQVATLGVLVGWLAGDFLYAGDNLDRSEVLLLWAGLAMLLILGRVLARWVALRLSPTERCLFVGDATTARTVESKLADHHGLKAKLVAQIDPAGASAWSADELTAPRLSEIRDLARSLGVQRAIIAADSLESERMLRLVSTLDAVGVKVSVLPRLLEVVGSSVQFDDLHGV